MKRYAPVCHLRKITQEEKDSNTGKEICLCCLQVIAKMNPHSMDGQKCRMLAYLHGKGVEVGGEGWVTVKAGRSKTFSGDDQVHAMRASWFGLVERGPNRSALYRISENGLAFLRGELLVPQRIYCRKGKVECVTEETISFDFAKNQRYDKDFWDRYHLFQRKVMA